MAFEKKDELPRLLREDVYRMYVNDPETLKEVLRIVEEFGKKLTK